MNNTLYLKNGKGSIVHNGNFKYYRDKNGKLQKLSAGGVVGSTLTGAGTGAAIGSTFSPIGTAIGAVAGAAVGFGTGFYQHKQEQKAAAALAKYNQDAMNRQRANIDQNRQAEYGDTIGYGMYSMYSKGGKININPKNKDKFTETMKRTGKSVEELKNNPNPLTRKRAVFALNAKKWKHRVDGGKIDDNRVLRAFPKDTTAERARLLAEQEAKNKVVTKSGSGSENKPKPKPKPTVTSTTESKLNIPKYPIVRLNPLENYMPTKGNIQPTKEQVYKNKSFMQQDPTMVERGLAYLSTGITNPLDAIGSVIYGNPFSKKYYKDIWNNLANTDKYNKVIHGNREDVTFETAKGALEAATLNPTGKLINAGAKRLVSKATGRAVESIPNLTAANISDVPYAPTKLVQTAERVPTKFGKLLGYKDFTVPKFDYVTPSTKVVNKKMLDSNPVTAKAYYNSIRPSLKASSVENPYRELKFKVKASDFNKWSKNQDIAPNQLKQKLNEFYMDKRVIKPKLIDDNKIKLWEQQIKNDIASKQPITTPTSTKTPIALPAKGQSSYVRPIYTPSEQTPITGKYDTYTGKIKQLRKYKGESMKITDKGKAAVVQSKEPSINSPKTNDAVLKDWQYKVYFNRNTQGTDFNTFMNSIKNDKAKRAKVNNEIGRGFAKGGPVVADNTNIQVSYRHIPIGKPTYSDDQLLHLYNMLGNPNISIGANKEQKIAKQKRILGYMYEQGSNDRIKKLYPSTKFPSREEVMNKALSSTDAKDFNTSIIAMPLSNTLGTEGMFNYADTTNLPPIDMKQYGKAKGGMITNASTRKLGNGIEVNTSKKGTDKIKANIDGIPVKLDDEEIIVRYQGSPIVISDDLGEADAYRKELAMGANPNMLADKYAKRAMILNPNPGKGKYLGGWADNDPLANMKGNPQPFTLPDRFGYNMYKPTVSEGSEYEYDYVNPGKSNTLPNSRNGYTDNYNIINKYNPNFKVPTNNMISVTEIGSIPYTGKVKNYNKNMVLKPANIKGYNRYNGGLGVKNLVSPDVAYIKPGGSTDVVAPNINPPSRMQQFAHNFNNSGTGKFLANNGTSIASGLGYLGSTISNVAAYSQMLKQQYPQYISNKYVPANLDVNKPLYERQISNIRTGNRQLGNTILQNSANSNSALAKLSSVRGREVGQLSDVFSQQAAERNRIADANNLQLNRMNFANNENWNTSKLGQYQDTLSKINTGLSLAGTNLTQLDNIVANVKQGKYQDEYLKSVAMAQGVNIKDGATPEEIQAAFIDALQKGLITINSKK